MNEKRYYVVAVPLPETHYATSAMRCAQIRARESKNANELLELAKKDFLEDHDEEKEFLLYELGRNENSDEETMDIVVFHHYANRYMGHEMPEIIVKNKNLSKKAIEKVASFTLKGDADYESVDYHCVYSWLDTMINICYQKNITTKVLDEFTKWTVSENSWSICEIDRDHREIVIKKKYKLLQAIIISSQKNSEILDKIVNFITSNYKKSDTYKKKFLYLTNEQEKDLLIMILDSSKVTAKMISAIYDMKAAEYFSSWYLILSRIAEDPLTDIKILRELARCKYSNVRTTLAENPKIDAEIRDILADDPNQLTRMIIAKDEKTSVKKLKKLASDENYYVRYNVAGNRTSTEEIFEIIVTEQEEADILAEVYDNKSASDSIRKRILDIWEFE